MYGVSESVGCACLPRIHPARTIDCVWICSDDAKYTRSGRGDEIDPTYTQEYFLPPQPAVPGHP